MASEMERGRLTKSLLLMCIVWLGSLILPPPFLPFLDAWAYHAEALLVLILSAAQQTIQCAML